MNMSILILYYNENNIHPVFPSMQVVKI